MMGWVWLACFALCSGRLALAHEDRVLLRVLGHRADDGRQLPDAAAAAAPVVSDAVPVPSVDVPVSSDAVPVPSADVPVSSVAVPVPSAAVPASTVAPSVPSPAGLVTQSAAPADATTLRRRVTEATSLAPPLPPSLQDRKKAKKNSTLGEEVITTLIDGWSGESEDSKFGSEIREQFGFLVQAVTKLGAAAIDEYAKPSRTARAVDNVGEGRRRQVRRLLVRYLVLLKVFALGIILPGAVLLSLLQSWKAVTLSLMALLLAGVIGIRGLVNSAAKGQTAEVIHTTSPGGHYWRRVSAEQAPQDPDRLAYSAYVPVS